MGPILASILWGLASKLLTERVISHLIVYSLNDVAQKTTNKLDDQIVKTVADGLAVEL